MQAVKAAEPQANIALIEAARAEKQRAAEPQQEDSKRRQLEPEQKEPTPKEGKFPRKNESGEGQKAASVTREAEALLERATASVRDVYENVLVPVFHKTKKTVETKLAEAREKRSQAAQRGEKVTSGRSSEPEQSGVLPKPSREEIARAENEGMV